MSTRAPRFYDFLHLNHKISFNLSVEVVIFLAFHNPFMMIFHILMSVSDHELMLDNFLITSSVPPVLVRPKMRRPRKLAHLKDITSSCEKNFVGEMICNVIAPLFIVVIYVKLFFEN